MPGFTKLVALTIFLWLGANLILAQGTSPDTNRATLKPADLEAASTNKYRVPSNLILESLIPLSPTARLSVANSKNPMVYTAREGIAVPAGFSPTNIYPLLIVSGTSDGDGSSLRAMRGFTNIALRLGWVVLAVDGPNGKPGNDNPPWRWAMLSTGLDHVHNAWPASTGWPVAGAGFSGGAKWSAIMAAILCQKDYNVIGVFMGGCNQDLASEAAKLYYPATKFRQLPFFLSSGTEDSIATPAQHSAVKQSMNDNDFNNVRLESYKGGHSLAPSELRTALLWFMEQNAKSPDKEVKPKEGREAEPASPEKTTEAPKKSD